MGTYRQCCLEKQLDNGTENSVGWINEEFAKVGKSLKMENDDGSFDYGWKVSFVGGRKTRAQVKFDGKDHERMVKKDA